MHIGVPEAIVLFLIVIRLVGKVYISIVEQNDKVNPVASVMCNILSACIDIALLTWGGFFS